MKKLLLTLAAVGLGLAATANETVVINMSDAGSDNIDGTYVPEEVKESSSTAEHWQPLKSFVMNGFTFEFTSTNKNASSQPAIYGSTTASGKTEKTLRVYAETTMTVTAPAGVNIVQIDFKGSNKVPSFTATPGTWTAGTEYDGTKGANNATWKGSANSFSVACTAAWRVTEMTITTGESTGDDPVVDPKPDNQVTYLSSTNAEGAADWTLGAENLPEGLTYVWLWKSYNGAYYLNASAYAAGTAYAVSEMAVSPVIELGTTGNAVMSFEHAAKFQTTLLDLCKVAVREAGAADWTFLTIPTWPTAGTWDFVSSGDIDLNAYKGKKIQIGFLYESSSAGADTWEIRDLKVSPVASAPVIDPTPDVVSFTPVKTPEALVSGKKYVFVVDGQLGSPVAATATYGRLNLSAATFAGENVQAEEAKALVITEAEMGFTIQDQDGRYYGMDLEHLTSFQIYTEAQDGCYWLPDMTDDGAFEFTNDLTDCIISRTKGTNGTFYTNIAPAAIGVDAVEGEDYQLPMLYILADSSVSTIDADNATAPVVFYNLQGVRVENPANGIFIRRQGEKVSKIIVK